MRKPRIIMCNSVSLDGAFTGIQFDVRQHLTLNREYWRQMALVGSRNEETGGPAPPETEADFFRPENKAPGIPWFVIPDSRGTMMGKLHGYRQVGYCRDVIVLVTEKTDRDFIDYLEQRHYDYFVSGKEKVDLVQAMDWLVEKYDVDLMMVDAGSTLNGVLLELKLLDEIWLLVHPVLSGNNSKVFLNQLAGSGQVINLDLIECREVENGLVLLHYAVHYN